MSRQILALRDHLAAEAVTCVVMEAAGDYRKPFYYLLEDLPGVEVMLVSARHVKNLPGARPMRAMPRGWPGSVPMAWSAARSCRLSRCGSCGT
jgi:transposase